MLAEQEKFGSSSNPRVLGIILARGGSKSVIKKNIRPLLGKPLIAYTICEALRSRWISRLIVSSDSEEIRRTAIQYGAQAPFVRPAELATDSATALLISTPWLGRKRKKAFLMITWSSCFARTP